MFPQPMPRSDFSTEDSHTDLATILEQHLRAGFQPDLALDLVLNELVIRAAEATRANSAALALVRGEELVCRAATGNFAPDLGVPLNPREGLSGVCLRTREPQLSVDTEIDPRVAVAFSRRFGIRSVLAVPVFDANDPSQFTGVLEVFSPTAAAFSRADQRVLEAFSAECARVRRTALELSKHPQAVENSAFEVAAPGSGSAAPAIDVSWLSIPMLAPRILPVPEAAEPEIASPEEADEPAAEADRDETDRDEDGTPEPESFEPANFAKGVGSRAFDSETSDSVSGKQTTSEVGTSVGVFPDRPFDRKIPDVRKTPEIAVPEFLKFVPTPPRRSGYEAWSVVLGTLAVLSIIAVSFLIGSRIGWLRATASTARSSARPAVVTPPVAESIAIETGEVGAEPSKPKPKQVRKEAKAAPPEKADPDANSGDLVVYEKGKVVFRMKNPQGSATEPSQADSNPSADATLAASAAGAAPSLPAKAGSTRAVWLNPTDAEDRLVTRIEPDYPMAARTAHRAGDVVLEVGVAEDGSVYSVRTLRGDPLLAGAAMQAVRSWRYQPYLLNEHPSQFHTDVTVSFATSN
jgi:TonB family protein